MLFKLAVDCIILAYDPGDNQLKVLLVQRENEPAKGQWALPGGFVDEPEDFAVTAARKLRQETGVTVPYLEQVRAYALTDPTVGQRLASVSYYALLEWAHYAPAADRTHLAQWFALPHVPALPFDHARKVQDAWQRVQEAARNRPVPFYLLPPKFPLNQLQRFYEALYQAPLDNRNFRKWVKGLPYVEALAELETNVSHRPSQLYQFKASAYAAFGQATRLTPY
ncbi:NUDIX hydrolase [Hymenobacter sp. RP-2-7]|uniref:NUDIX hydrolase n=1 Tax=Hymenobacter polaris TaxID=2682546 RepID=A0A7Y0AIQ6_9BACT|nr:NUDIX domain-containing protein [Hymenobacter polaris]NML67922.1 NUDIX hydrolase [Hymenobacter polaris]